MQKLTIKNIGAIKLVEFEVNRINVFMGPQSSGKSTISKILCHCQWVEKTCFLNDKQLENYQKQGVFYDSLVEYHKLDGYFHKNASIKYEGEAMTITYTHSSKKTTIKLNDKMIFSYPKYVTFLRNVTLWLEYLILVSIMKETMCYFILLMTGQKLKKILRNLIFQIFLAGKFLMKILMTRTIYLTMDQSYCLRTLQVVFNLYCLCTRR